MKTYEIIFTSGKTETVVAQNIYYHPGFVVFWRTEEGHLSYGAGSVFRVREVPSGS